MKKQIKVYLDYNSTTPVDSKVVDAMLPYFTQTFGNANSDHYFGWDAEEAVELARRSISKLVHAKPTEVIFTSGATEAANLALFGFCERNSSKGRHIITAKTEHKAILDPIQELERQGFQVTYLDVDTQGNIDLEELATAITHQTLLVCLMLANNETGAIHPIKEIEKIVHNGGAKLLCDITQAVGKILVDLQSLNVDIALFSAHKLYGPKGIGALYINKKNRALITPKSFGGGQEKGIRPGTLNVPGIVGFGKAAEIASEVLEKESIRLSKLRDTLEQLLEDIEGTIINVKNTLRIPNTTSISFKNIDGEKLLRRLGTVAVSRGSACSSITVRPSHVLKAMGLSDTLALSTFRISLGRNTNEADIEFAAEEIKKAVYSLQTLVI